MFFRSHVLNNTKNFSLKRIVLNMAGKGFDTFLFVGIYHSRECPPSLWLPGDIFGASGSLRCSTLVQ